MVQADLTKLTATIKIVLVDSLRVYKAVRT